MSVVQCLACKSGRNHPLAYWGRTPLSVLGLPRSEAEARKMARLVMDLRRCAICGHVFHTEFDYEKIPYRTGSNLVYNQSHYWQAYQDALAREWIGGLGLAGRRVVEIGCGDGGFLVPFLEAGCACVAFEPGPDADKARARGIETYREYFQASRLVELRPHAIICRHVLEHLADPMDFLQDVAVVCAGLDARPLFLAEVPRIDKALAQHRINDFLWEHVSHFTDRSLRTLFERAGFEVQAIAARYGEEVVTAVAAPALGADIQALETESQAFQASVERQVRAVRQTVDGWLAAGRRVALWGGTGKGAALMNMFDLSRERMPIVIDSDPRKVGGYVPGTGQRIEGPAFLADHPVDAILVCTQWRARDIEHEIRTVHGLDVDLCVYFDEAIRPLTDDLDL